MKYQYTLFSAKQISEATKTLFQLKVINAETKESVQLGEQLCELTARSVFTHEGSPVVVVIAWGAYATGQVFFDKMINTLNSITKYELNWNSEGIGSENRPFLFTAFPLQYDAGKASDIYDQIGVIKNGDKLNSVLQAWDHHFISRIAKYDYQTFLVLATGDTDDTASECCEVARSAVDEGIVNDVF
jgi:hypothetical protein